MMKTAQLSDVCDFLDSMRRPVTAKDRVAGIYPYYGANGVLDYVDSYLFDEELVLLAEDGGFFDDPKRGVAYRVSGKCWVNNHAHVLRPKKNIDVDYLGYVLKQYDIRPYITGATVKKLNQKAARQITIPFPFLEDQKRIVKILDQMDILRKKRKQAISLLDDYLKSVFLEMFGDPMENPKGWKIKTLQSLTTKLGDGLHGTPKFSEKGDYFFINGNNLENGKIIIKDSTKKVSHEEFKKYKKPLDETSMLVSINGTLGRVAFYCGENIILGKSACYFNIKRGEVNSTYLYNILNSDFFLKYATGNSTGSTIKNVSLKTMREFPVIFPPPPLQNKFSNIVEKTESLKLKMLAQSEELENQFQALMQKAFKDAL